MRVYHPGIFHRLMTLIGGFSLLVAWVMVFLLFVISLWEREWAAAFCVAPLFILFASHGFLFGYWLYPRITVGPDGISVTGLRRDIEVPFEDLVALKRPLIPFMGDAIIARRVTPYHYLYGLVFCFRLEPAILVSPDMSKREELLDTLQRRLRHERELS
jgi:hypothetical protein